jgi:Tol biopolymer transport system component
MASDAEAAGADTELERANSRYQERVETGGVSVNKIFHILACGAVLALLVCPATAEPNRKEIKTARLLVPEEFSDRGAYSPAVSPDGKTVAFHASDGFYILHAENLYEEKDLKPWKLQVKMEPDGWMTGPCRGLERSKEIRELDWSPNGVRLAFVYNGRLWVASDFDYPARTNKARLLANLREFPDEKLFAKSAGRPKARVQANPPWRPRLTSPRWSPDGKRIAVLREEGYETLVAVADVESGKQRIVAADALGGSDAWNQPWLPDGKSLAFSAGVPKLTSEYKDEPNVFSVSIDGQRIDVVAADGASRRTLLKGSSEQWLLSPSWSPTSSMVAYTAFGKCVSTDGLGRQQKGAKQMIWLVDGSGKQKRTISTIPPYFRDYAARVIELNKEMEPEVERIRQKLFEKEFGKSLTPDQSNRLQEGKMTADDMLDLAFIISARDISTDFERKVTDLVNSPDWNLKDQSADWGELLGSLTDTQRDELLQRSFGFLAEAAAEGMGYRQSVGSDDCPTWSPDGKSIAFICGLAGDTTLEVIDIATGRQRTVFTADYKVACPTWTGDSKSLVFESTRILKRSRQDRSTVTTPSQPEIWMVQVR